MKGGSFFGPGGLRLVMHPDDPDTPIMLYLKDASATWYCGFETGDIEGYALTDEQMKWLSQHEEMAEAFYNEHRVIEDR